MLSEKRHIQVVNIHPVNTHRTILPTIRLRPVRHHNRASLINTSILLMEHISMDIRLLMTHMQKILATVGDITAVRDPRM